MIRVRPDHERGRARHGRLDTKYTFSFADYYDPAHMGFRALRVINEDHIAPGAGFPMHPHRDMEIITYVLDGELAHRDSLGTGSVIRPGEVQRMSAGTGIVHSEFNASDAKPIHLLQIWILPERRGIAPGYEQKAFPPAERTNGLRLIAAPDGADGAVTIHQDVRLYSAILEPGREVTHIPAPGRHAWVQVARGAISLNGEELHAGDGAAVGDERELTLAATEPAEVLLFDLA